MFELVKNKSSCVRGDSKIVFGNETLENAGFGTLVHSEQAGLD